ncbi:NAD-binding protein [Desulfosarcina ovata]|uniref:Response regulatory domain-containing protein n=1 Tax=Desulfosarcina ovata subsp. ovata TaxID=2752305 RepID=A0A5K8A4K8_9BACT|nr:NAD-binding protein [Desulfosarcina ovata]BBO87348.1 hypothetical protein DSCOOX_05280 [Desulfosarcina ovata subsp. ovata]
MSSRKKIIAATIILISIVLGGTFGYMQLERYTFFQGLYMSVITISTVGYGEIIPLSPKGQGFSIALIFSSIIGLAFAGRALGESLLENTWSGRAEKRKMHRRIQSLKGHQIICGFGRVGHAAASQFVAARSDFVIVDQAPGAEVGVDGQLYLEGDATREQILLDAGIKEARGLLALLGSDPENVFLVLTARELNPTLRIIARANDPNVENKLLKAGADKVISPFTTAGTQIAHEMLLATGQHDDVCAFADVVHTPRWISLGTDNPLIDTSISHAAHQLGGAVLGLRRGNRDCLLPGENEVLKDGDVLLVIQADQEPGNKPSKEPAPIRNVVIVDDNPVIVKLYTRLFQKAGFVPHTAANGTAGLKLILRLRPAAAVIDFMLPVFSGIEICEKVRQTPELNRTRLILFTADDNAATRQRALSAGADAVVVKSADAQEVINTVVQTISENLPPVDEGN